METVPRQPEARGGQHRGSRRGRQPRGRASSRGQRSIIAGDIAHEAEGAMNPAIALTPASVAPRSALTTAEPSSAEQFTSERLPRPRIQGRGGRGNRNGNLPGQRGGRGRESTCGRGSRGHILTSTGHKFGGQLTASSALQASAPEFTPGKPVPTPPRPRRAALFKSTAPDIATRTHEDIAHGFYECPICTNDILASSKIWSCRTCWTVFHLSCVKKWSQNEGSALAQQRQSDDELPPPRQWRCPGCNLPKDDFPSSYKCWCEKEADPRPLGGVAPHSCGQSCGKTRPNNCPHVCDRQCHAGPCPPCTYMGSEQSCFCGKNISRKRCVDTQYNEGWCCGEICGDVLPCGDHSCSRPCHEGLCGACEEVINGRCYCGKVAKPIACRDKQDAKWSRISTEASDEDWTGIFDCGRSCGRLFDCGKHECQQPCHPQSPETSRCPQSPEVVSHCPCQKTLLESLGICRSTCEDPIPSCNKECSKTLPCGHVCQRACHVGACPPCTKKVNIACRCSRVSTQTVCHQGTDEAPMCMRTCKATLNCGRHDCGEHCCPGEKKASERMAIKRKLRPLGGSIRALDEGIEAEHICTRVCGRPLKCGNHTCLELCHKGACGTCREAIFDEVSCSCGRTVLQPPLPCGTSLPPCRYQCETPKACGHPQTQHNCHGSSEACPKCPFLVEKPCMCAKKTLKNQPCFFADVRCGEICGKRLRCGSHFCRKPCHRLGECEDVGTHCQQRCGKAKKACSHPCEERCHAPSTCKEEKSCSSKLFITCECQNIKTEVKCLASRTNEGNSKKTLKCDDECARLERNRQLALALNIDADAHTDDHIPYSTQTLKLYQESQKRAQEQERELRLFAADDDARRLRFKPSPPNQRAFLHSVADDFGFDSESMDPEPHRHVVLFKTPKFVKAPMKTLADCIRIRVSNATLSSATSAIVPTSAARLQVPNDPFNGFVLSSPRFGLTIDELRTGLITAFSAAPTIAFDITYLPSEEIVFKARPSAFTTTMAPSALETAVKQLSPSINAAVTGKRAFAASVAMCALDESMNVIRREAKGSGGGGDGGWSQVAAKAAVGHRGLVKKEGWGGKSSFMVLGRKKKEEKKEVEVVDDWEEEMNREEEKKRTNGEDGDSVRDAASGEEEEVLDAGPVSGREVVEGIAPIQME